MYLTRHVIIHLYIFNFLYRNHAVGLASFWENVGGIVAPFIVYGVRKKYNMYY